MKKILALVVALCMLTAPLASLADGLYDGEPVKLQMLVWNSVETYEQLNDELLEQFPEMDAKVDIEVVLTDDTAKYMRLLLASGEPLPDMVRLNYTQFAEFYAAGLLYDMTVAVAPYQDEIIPAVYDLMKGEDGGVYCLPQEVKPKIWYYRSDIFEQAGVDPTQVKTVDELIEAARTVHDKTGTYIENYIPPFNPYDLIMLLSGNGGSFCDENGDFNIASDENVRAAFEHLKKLYDSGCFSTDVEWSADWQAAFTEGKLTSQLTGSWMKQHLINWCPDQAGLWSCCLWPEEFRSGSEACMGIWVVPKDSAHPELTADILAKYSFDPEYRKTVFGINGIIPPIESAKTDPAYAEHSYFGPELRDVYFQGMEYLQSYPYTPTFSTEQTIVVSYLDEYVNGNIDLDTALNNAQADLINQIGNAYD